MATKTKCPSCDAELNIDADPLLKELKDAVDALGRENVKLREKLESAGVKPPAASAMPAAAQTSRKAERRGIVTLLDDDEDEEGESDGEES